MIILRVKTRRGGGGGGGGGGINDDDKNMVQIHDEQRSIQMTILHRDIYIYTKNTAHTSTVITNNGSKNSKCRPESDTQ